MYRDGEYEKLRNPHILSEQLWRNEKDVVTLKIEHATATYLEFIYEKVNLHSAHIYVIDDHGNRKGPFSQKHVTKSNKLVTPKIHGKKGSIEIHRNNGKPPTFEVTGIVRGYTDVEMKNVVSDQVNWNEPTFVTSTACVIIHLYPKLLL